jgi:hypothetical protein
MPVLARDDPPAVDDPVSDAAIKYTEVFRISTMWFAVRLMRVQPNLFPESEFTI